MTSKIKVDNIADQDDNNLINESGDVITVGAAGDTVAVAGNIVKSNAYQASDGGNIVSQSGTTVTLGASGDTITLASGASQTGFGRTGTVDWETTVKTASFTATSGEGYFCNTTSSAFTVTLPASPSAGDIVAVKDYAATFATNNLTIGRNSQPIGGVADNLVLSTNQQSITLIYIDGTKGWLATNDSTTNAVPTKFVAATGGNTVATCGNFKIHTFTSPGTFTVSCAGNSAGSNTVDYLVVGGGGAGGSGSSGGGGGAGGYRESSGAASGCYTRSPLGACVSALPVTAQGYPIAIGGGGSKGTAGGEDCQTTGGTSGAVSTFSTITSAGGGRGASASSAPNSTAENGGSGGGGNGSITNGNGNTPPVSPPQGQPGRAATTSPSGVAGGGGGAVSCAPSNSWVGKDGATSNINGTPTIRATGGGGGKNSPTGIPGDQGPRGGGKGGSNNISGNSGATGPTDGGNAGDNTGSGGGGGGRQVSVTSRPGGNGGSGIVIIRYKFQ